MELTTSETFGLQDTLFGGVALHCPRCGTNLPIDPDWLHDYQGCRSSCGRCGHIATVPKP